MAKEKRIRPLETQPRNDRREAFDDLPYNLGSPIDLILQALPEDSRHELTTHVGEEITRVLKKCEDCDTSWWRFIRNSDGKTISGHKCPCCLTYFE